jgi:hypothetical protein
MITLISWDGKKNDKSRGINGAIIVSPFKLTKITFL